MSAGSQPATPCKGSARRSIHARTPTTLNTPSRHEGDVRQKKSPGMTRSPAFSRVRSKRYSPIHGRHFARMESITMHYSASSPFPPGPGRSLRRMASVSALDHARLSFENDPFGADKLQLSPKRRKKASLMDLKSPTASRLNLRDSYKQGLSQPAVHDDPSKTPPPGILKRKPSTLLNRTPTSNERETQLKKSISFNRLPPPPSSIRKLPSMGNLSSITYKSTLARPLPPIPQPQPQPSEVKPLHSNPPADLHGPLAPRPLPLQHRSLRKSPSMSFSNHPLKSQIPRSTSITGLRQQTLKQQASSPRQVPRSVSTPGAIPGSSPSSNLLKSRMSTKSTPNLRREMAKKNPPV